ncbi:MAG: outer membrane beta-barrel protein [Aldersonia sp.]|nr:outer membrane beta-barrel protein [Aldersonia sp.]
MKNALIIAALAALLAPPDAQAQMQWTDKGFLSVNFGVQAGSHDLDTNTTFDLYEEPATISSGQSVDGGPFFEIGAGYRVWRNLALGVAYSRVTSDADVNITGSIPDPVFFDRPRPVTGSVGGAEHSQQAVHLQGVWMVPFTDKVDIGLAFGPSIFLVSQDVPSAVSVSEPGPTISSISVNSADATTLGFHAGIDVTYLVTPRVGVGGIARYSWGSADIEGATDNLTVGDFQIGAGIRFRF